MILEIPFSNDPSQSFVTQLDDKKYIFDARFNDRSGVWTMDITDDSSKLPLIQSVPLLLGAELLEPYNLGIGRMIVIDTSNRGVDAGFNDLGDRVKVYWVSNDEVLA